jgi:hypothetical protein
MIKTIPIKDVELHAKLKIECVKRGITITTAAEEAIRQLLATWRTAPPAHSDGGGAEAEERSEGDE